MIKPATRLSLLSIVVAIAAIAAVAAEETLSPWLLKVIPVSLQAWIVCPEGPPSCQFSKIQEAIDGVPEGTTIEIKAGIYEENLLIRKSITLKAIGEEQVIVKSATESLATLLLASGRPIQVSISGLTILPARKHTGNGIEIMGLVEAKIERNTIENYRWGILVLGKPERLSSAELSVSIRENTIRGNRSSILIINSVDVSISKNTFQENGVPAPEDVGGIYISDSQKIAISDNTIEGSGLYGMVAWRSKELQIASNFVKGNPFGIFLAGTQGDVGNNQIERNGVGVAIAAEGPFDSRVSIKDNHIIRNDHYGLMTERLEQVTICEQNYIRENQQEDYLVQYPLFSLMPRRDFAAEEALRKQCEDS